MCSERILCLNHDSEFGVSESSRNVRQGMMGEGTVFGCAEREHPQSDFERQGVRKKRQGILGR